MGRTAGRARTATGPTLAVVAREAGVSVPTASKVVNGREDVAPETRRRVTEVLDRLGYVRRPRFEAAPARMVDLVLPSLDSSRSGAVLRGVEAAAYEAGLEVVVSAGPGVSEEERPEQDRLARLARRGSPGALFALAELSASQYAWLARQPIPFVMIDPAVAPPPGVMWVGAADRRGGIAATEHLLALGHERIAVITGHRGGPADDARLAGHRAALAAAGVPHRPAYVRHAGPDRLSARHRMRELLDLPAPPTAVFVCSDTLALGVYEALAERGLRVPDDVSVVGFDDLPEARWAGPALTTVRRPFAEMAATALRLLLRLRDGDLPEGTRTELPTRLVRRASTAPPATPR